MKISKELLIWLTGGDTGISSEAMVSRNFNLPLKGYSNAWGYPSDGDDFGRCYRLLKAVPEIRVEKMTGFNRIWDDLVAVWPELSAMYEKNGGMGICSLINQLTDKYRKNHSMLAEDILY